MPRGMAPSARIGRLTTPHYRDVFLKGGRHALRVVRVSHTDSRITSGSSGSGVERVRSRTLESRIRADYGPPTSPSCGALRLLGTSTWHGCQRSERAGS